MKSIKLNENQWTRDEMRRYATSMHRNAMKFNEIQWTSMKFLQKARELQTIPCGGGANARHEQPRPYHEGGDGEAGPDGPQSYMSHVHWIWNHNTGLVRILDTTCLPTNHRHRDSPATNKPPLNMCRCGARVGVYWECKKTTVARHVEFNRYKIIEFNSRWHVEFNMSVAIEFNMS